MVVARFSMGSVLVLGLRGGMGKIQTMLELEAVPLLLEPFFLLGDILYGLVAFLNIYASSNGGIIKRNGINMR
ncbi:hypothetical protein CR203_22900 [Salipaludibacillus neizhouensis]|uniref:Uncharacterized protein n=1 Tax=Salipaludibacillus neizhouensis TaxID=885475 RepID=A0A3A9JVT7_9BACI|nr:hypothetical protein CR203_22900 [Salipaludibacillus neizhouensis]